MRTEPLTLHIKPAYIPFADESCEGMRLMEHQQAVLEAEEKLVILDAPTSSGKTLAMLARVLKSDGNGLFLYPTNELIIDQADGLKKLLERMGKRAAVLPLVEGSERSVELREDVDVVIAVATGDSLEGIARTKGEALARLLRVDTKMILLSNIDVLTLMVKQRYHGYLASDILSELLSKDWKVLAVDELHLYHGVMLANLMYLVWLLRDRFSQIIVSSATHHDSTELLKQMFESCVHIKPNVLSERESGARQIRHACELSIYPLPTKADERLAAMYEAVMGLYSSKRVLAIVNSVAESELLADMLEADKLEVGRINGLVPKEKRERDKPITVGTMAIEVGVDFDVSRLVFEASDAHAFMQRFGRASRCHDGKKEEEGIARAFVHEDVLRVLKESPHVLKGELSLDELESLVLESMPKTRTYSSLASSKYGVLLLAALLYSLDMRIKSTAQRVAHVKEHIHSLKPPFVSEKVVEDAKKYIRHKLMSTIADGGARGDILSVPALIERYGTYMRVDVLELARAEFRFEQIDRTGAPPWVKEDVVAVVSAWRKRPLPEASFTGKSNAGYIQYIDDGNFSLYIEDEVLLRHIKRLLAGKLIYPTWRVQDWRLTSVKDPKRGMYLVIGLDALVQQHIEEGAH